MSDDAAKEYEACEQEILRLRSIGATDEQEEPILDRMDRLWAQMTPEEQALANERPIASST